MLGKVYTKEQMQLYSALKNYVNQTARFVFNDPDTGEVWALNTVPIRLARQLPLWLEDGMPAQEIMEMMEGFFVIQKFGLDMNNPEHAAYTKKRWLSSAKTLYDMEKAVVKRIESTYGTLTEQLPNSVFMASLGIHQGDYYKRCHFTQEVAQMVDDKFCISAEGKKFSVGELLIREGMATKEDIQELYTKNCEYYE